jgi:dipeptidase
MSYGIYIGKNHASAGHAWLGGYGDEPSSHWLEVVPAKTHPAGAMIDIGVGADADMPGVRGQIPQINETFAHIRVSYSYYLGVPAPITNGGLNQHGVAVRDIWSTSRVELKAMTPKDQTGVNYSDIARIVLERATSARNAVEVAAALIAAHGEATYGGNSHIFADANEAWVMIQFAGGRGLWAAERLGPDSIRASRPGYILEMPVNDETHPNFLWSPHFVDFAKEMGWYTGGAFNANDIYGDGKGRWDGVAWIEAEMRVRAAQPKKIQAKDVFWAVRTEKLTGDTAGYGQVVPLVNPLADGLRMLWHSPIGAMAAPFAPVFMGQTDVPPEFAKHRYLTVGESHRFMDMRKAVSGGSDVVASVPQRTEATKSAVFEAKRLMYLMQLGGEDMLRRITKAFGAREGWLRNRTDEMLQIAELLVEAGNVAEANKLLEYFSQTELRAGLELIVKLSTGIEAELTADGSLVSGLTPVAFEQIW